ncbi:FkbM family methyltransferase [Mucisphaera sp.]|uniref:FkbM family methyltransferase n=1 Tax=Mucisphaera sp. TaxID=2913024 RepID=UPI003D12E160
MKLNLKGGQGDWYTFLENMLRNDYLDGHDYLSEGDTVLDVGANIGAFTIVASRLVGDTGKVFSYEPDPVIFKRLLRNLEINNINNVNAINGAVGAVSTKAAFYSSNKSAYSSLAKQVDGRNTEKPSFEVDVIAIDEALSMGGDSIKLMKIDCEGGEYEIFDALNKNKASSIKYIVRESHIVPGRDVEDMYRRIEDLGFAVTRGYPMRAVRAEP